MTATPAETDIRTAAPLGCVAFEGSTLLAAGPLPDVALAMKDRLDHTPEAVVLVFDQATGNVVEVDLRGSREDVLERLEKAEPGSDRYGHRAMEPMPPRTPGRPRLGVVAREVTLLPRHWEWLASQPGGASVALRKLVEDARRASGERDRQRAAQEACYRFMVAVAGNEPGFEDASRALYAGNEAKFHEAVENWPRDVRTHAREFFARQM